MPSSHQGSLPGETSPRGSQREEAQPTMESLLRLVQGLQASITELRAEVTSARLDNLLKENEAKRALLAKSDAHSRVLEDVVRAREDQAQAVARQKELEAELEEARTTKLPSSAPSPTPQAKTVRLPPSPHTPLAEALFASEVHPSRHAPLALSTPRQPPLVPMVGRGDYSQEELYSTATGPMAPPVHPADYTMASEKTASKNGPKLAFPKWQEGDLELSLIEIESWFQFYEMMDAKRQIQYLGPNLEGRALQWYRSKLRVDPSQSGILFNNWTYFVDRLKELYGHHDVQYEAYLQLHAIRLASDKAGKAIEYVEQFRALADRAQVSDERMKMLVFRNGLTPSLQRLFERDPPKSMWEWYRQVEAID